MKKLMSIAFTVGALSLLTLNVFASDAGRPEPNKQTIQKVETNNQGKALNEDLQDDDYCEPEYRTERSENRRSGRRC